MSANQAYHGKSVGWVAGTDRLGRATGPMTLEEIAGRFNPYRPAKNRPQPQDLAIQTPAATPLSGYSKPPGLVLAGSVGAKTYTLWAYCPGAPLCEETTTGPLKACRVPFWRVRMPVRAAFWKHVPAQLLRHRPQRSWAGQRKGHCSFADRKAA